MSTTPFPELASEIGAISWAEIDPTKVLGRRRSPWCPVMARGGAEGVVRGRMVAHGAGGRAVEPTQVDTRRGRCVVCASSVEKSGW